MRLPAGAWRDPSYAREDDHPVACVGRADAEAFAAWLSAATGARYRLPSEAEWEYAARGAGVAPCDDGYAHSAPVGLFAPNGFELVDMIGNLAERVADCFAPTYAAQPVDGGVHRPASCADGIARGGSWRYLPRALRSAHRQPIDDELGEYDVGFRLVREL